MNSWHKLMVVMSVTVIVVSVSFGCSSLQNDFSGKAASEEDGLGFQISSPSFTETRPKKRIPEKNTCYGENLSPPLNWSGTPSETKSFVLIAEDMDHHTGEPWVHWVIYNIPPSATKLSEGIPTSTPELPDGSMQGLNHFQNIGYEGPCPVQVEVSYWPSVEGRAKLAKGAHRYVFTLYALDTVISLPTGSTKGQLLGVMDKYILDKVDTVGKFQVAPIHRNKLAPEGEPTTVKKK